MERNFFKKICDENPKLCIDIGANVGNFSKYILRNSNSKVLAFEPHKKSFKELKKLKNYIQIELIFLTLVLVIKIRV